MAWTFKPEFFMCRGVIGHHSYERTGAIILENGAYKMRLVCINCSTVNQKEINRRSAATSNKYRHPPGYINHDKEKPARHELRLDAISSIYDRQQRRKAK